MANASINLLYSAPDFSYTVIRAPGTAASASGGGGAITTKPGTGEYGNNQKDFKKQLYGAVSACLSYIAANGNVPVSINMLDSSGTFTYSIFYSPGTVASGGTAITTKPTTGEAAKNTRDPRKMLWAAASALISDRAANG